MSTTCFFLFLVAKCQQFPWARSKLPAFVIETNHPSHACSCNQYSCKIVHQIKHFKVLLASILPSLLRPWWNTSKKMKSTTTLLLVDGTLRSEEAPQQHENWKQSLRSTWYAPNTEGADAMNLYSMFNHWQLHYHSVRLAVAGGWCWFIVR